MYTTASACTACVVAVSTLAQASLLFSTMQASRAVNLQARALSQGPCFCTCSEEQYELDERTLLAWAHAIHGRDAVLSHLTAKRKLG